MIQLSRNPVLFTGLIWLLSLSDSCTEPRMTVVAPTQLAELKTVLIALSITAFDEPSYGFNDSWIIANGLDVWSSTWKTIVWQTEGIFLIDWLRQAFDPTSEWLMVPHHHWHFFILQCYLSSSTHQFLLLIDVRFSAVQSFSVWQIPKNKGLIVKVYDIPYTLPFTIIWYCWFLE